MPFLGHSPYDGLDVSPDATPPARSSEVDPLARARQTVHRYAADPADEALLLDVLGLVETDAVPSN